MNRDELVSQIRFLLKLQEDKDAIIDRQQESLDEMKADLKEARKDNKALQKQLAESSKKLDAALASIEELRRQLNDIMNRNDLNNQHRFGSRIQKGITPKKSSGGVDRTEQKDSFSVPECTLLHRELTRMLAHNMSLSEKTLTNWLDKVSKFLYKMLPALKAKALEAGTAVNCDETSIRSMTVERKRSSYAGLLPTGRKNSLMFGSHKGAEMSAIFHTFIETCKMNGISTIEYFKKLLGELLTGNNKTRTLFAHSVGFENASLLPQTIGIKR